MQPESSPKGKTISLGYNQATIVQRDERAVCLQTSSSFSQLRITNLDKLHRATFILISDSDFDGTYTLAANHPDSTWYCSTNFNQHQLSVYNLSPGAASLEVMLMDTPVEY